MSDAIPARIIERLAENLRTRGRSMLAQQSSRPVEEYLDPALHALELRRLFHELPIVVAHSSQLPRPGDFITHDRLGVPLIVARTASGQVAAFRNICSHRAATVESAGCGHRKTFNCPYHNWSFGLDGALLHVPDEDSFDLGDRSGHGLRRIAAAERHGLVFVRVADGPPIDLEAFLGDLGAEFDALRVADHAFFSDRATPLACNWKVMLEGSLETYHIGFLHRDRIGGQFAPMHCRFDDYAPHQLHTMPKRNLLERLERGGDPRRSVLPTYCIFPNTMLTLPHDHMMLTQVFPLDVDRCVFYNSLLTLDAPAGEDAKAYWSRALRLTEGVNDEDFVVLEGIQRSHAAMAGEHVIHGRYELGITRFHAARERVLAGTLAAPWGRRRDDD
ncbi:MAG: aromatic ring-hydroxylating dioxygenase subunit alpha [Steroidobacteraceae bacterium]